AYTARNVYMNDLNVAGSTVWWTEASGDPDAAADGDTVIRSAPGGTTLVATDFARVPVPLSDPGLGVLSMCETSNVAFFVYLSANLSGLDAGSDAPSGVYYITQDGTSTNISSDLTLYAVAASGVVYSDGIGISKFTVGPSGPAAPVRVVQPGT